MRARILSSVFVTIDIGKFPIRELETSLQTIAYGTIDPYEALVVITVTNEAPFEFKAVKNYYLLDVEIDDDSVNSIAYYEVEEFEKNFFSNEILNLGKIDVAEQVPRGILIINVDQLPGQTFFTVRVYAKIFGFPILVKEKYADFEWESLPPLTAAIVNDFYLSYSDYYALHPFKFDLRRIADIAELAELAESAELAEGIAELAESAELAEGIAELAERIAELPP